MPTLSRWRRRRLARLAEIGSKLCSRAAYSVGPCELMNSSRDRNTCLVDHVLINLSTRAYSCIVNDVPFLDLGIYDDA